MEKTLQVQSVLYNADIARLRQVFIHLERAVQLAISGGYYAAINLSLGDCSPARQISDDELRELKSYVPTVESVSYTYFDNNIGSAGGHNVLLNGILTDYVLIMNPDVMLAPDCLIQLTKPYLKDESVGMVEARQLPIEHPKDYNTLTGETDWAATACALIDAYLATSLDGFDSSAFFLYCDDVDFSWRVRLAGRKVLFQPAAVAFHDKRLSPSGEWMPSNAEQYYSAEAALILAHKYSRQDIVHELLKVFTESDENILNRAADEYRARDAVNKLPKPIDSDHKVGRFYNGFYAKHRYQL